MREQSFTTPNNGHQFSGDLFRLSKSKEAVGCCDNTIRAYAKQGLRIYYVGKAAWVSRSEFEFFIRQTAQSHPPARASAPRRGTTRSAGKEVAS